jgi:hypothetical protein
LQSRRLWKPVALYLRLGPGDFLPNCAGAFFNRPLGNVATPGWNACGRLRQNTGVKRYHASILAPEDECDRFAVLPRVLQRMTGTFLVFERERTSRELCGIGGLTHLRYWVFRQP